jgi:hypothetical protein
MVPALTRIGVLNPVRQSSRFTRPTLRFMARGEIFSRNHHDIQVTVLMSLRTPAGFFCFFENKKPRNLRSGAEFETKVL